jgi:hypothetical protein
MPLHSRSQATTARFNATYGARIAGGPIESSPTTCVLAANRFPPNADQRSMIEMHALNCHCVMKHERLGRIVVG